MSTTRSTKESTQVGVKIFTGKPDIKKDQDVTLMHTVFDHSGKLDLHAGFGGKTVTDPKFKRDRGWFIDVVFVGRTSARTIPCIYLINKKLSEI